MRIEKRYYREFEGIPIEIIWEPDPFESNAVMQEKCNHQISHIVVRAWTRQGSSYQQEQDGIYRDQNVRKPLPTAPDGFISWWHHPDTIKEWGGGLEFVMGYLEHHAQEDEWQKTKTSTRQKELF